VQVSSARPLSDAQRDSLAAAVRERTGLEPSFTETVDPSLVGGLVVQIGDEKTDGSVVTRLRNLGEALLDRASREIHSGTYVEGTAT
jgi:F-type H+-transporting ATPase subunit delta